MPDIALEQLLRPEVLESLSSPASHPTQQPSDDQAQTTARDDEEFEFRLFSTSARASETGPVTALPKVILRSPSPSSTNLGFVIPHRPKEYYFASGERRAEYRNVAVTGEDVLAQRKTNWTGCHLPWRVITLKSPNSPSNPSPRSTKQPNALGLPGFKARKRRASKKRRIIIRRTLAANEERAKQALENKAAQEAAEREKRTRRNREKKVKKKQKEKAKKMEGKDGDEQGLKGGGNE
ncbi:MAG: hypothetical protein M1835_002016 [Candelina submexicana]|nr:MAG: hypothetical protein M1835_002016 [Candelina submexicana]